MTPASIDISICVPVYTQRGEPNLRTLHESLKPALSGLRGELVVALNGIDPIAAGAPPGSTVVDLGVNRGVSVAWNAAASRARADILCFVNDDVVLGPESLQRLRDALLERPDAGMVGPVGTCWNLAEARHLSWLSLKGLEPGEVRECDVVSGFLFATRREVYDRVGGFDERFTPCGFEEVDYSTKVRLEVGLRCYAIAGVAFEHDWGMSHARPWTRVRYDGRSETLFRIGRRNRRLFLHKWQAAQLPTPCEGTGPGE